MNRPSQQVAGRHLLAALLLGLISGTGSLRAQGGRDVVLATTTSTQDTGWLDSLVPGFEARCHCRVKTIAVGTGQALALGARGDADVVLTHAPQVEKRYVAEGAFINRRLVMSNDFVLVGPRDDPAGLRAITDLGTAMRRLAQGRAPFVSRGDSSGTNMLELDLWKAAGATPAGPWYLQAGQGMGATLRIASEKHAYALTDRGSFLALRPNLDLEIVFQGAPELLNLYHVMEVNPERHPQVNHAGARAFAAYLLSRPVQEFIGRFGRARFGQPLFIPRAGRREEDLLRPAQ